MTKLGSVCKALRMALVLATSVLTVAANPPPGYKLIRYTRKDKTSQPLIFGLVDQPGQSPRSLRRPIEIAFITTDGVATYTDATGHYTQFLQPGTHQVTAGFVGFLSVRLKRLRLHAGDSIYLNFQLQYDKRPFIN
ncbi:MAG: carboxypeptidase-like regulatory domain-containing protein [Janthinobacterium lividum]